jgi:hypothetical protein
VKLVHLVGFITKKKKQRRDTITLESCLCFSTQFNGLCIKSRFARGISRQLLNEVAVR